MARIVQHRWNVEEGRSPGDGLPVPGEIVAGPRNYWTVVEVLPVESRKHPNAWRARLRPNGPHEGNFRPGWWRYEPESTSR